MIKADRGREASTGHYIGLMTGTSMDGIDAALVQFDTDNKAEKVRIVATHSHPIPHTLKTELEKLSLPGEDTIDGMGSADAQLGSLLANAVNTLLTSAGLKAAAVTAIGSHGQTIRHRPPGDPSTPDYPFTLQVGDPNQIAALTNITTVADFRRRDMALGGQGAPLVPAFHKAVFQHSKIHRVIVNVGGIANITNLPPKATVTGFDTGPGNGLMDAWIKRHQNLPYDNEGQWAASHRHHPELLTQLKKHPFFTCEPPKSTGREDFNLDWLDAELTHFEKSNADSGPNLSQGVVQASLLALTAETIGEAIAETAPSATEIYICGGGALNTALMDTLKNRLAPAKVESTRKLGIAPQWVEAAAFAWLARQTLRGLPGSLAEVTGATKSAVLGAIYPAGPS